MEQHQVFKIQGSAARWLICPRKRRPLYFSILWKEFKALESDRYKIDPPASIDKWPILSANQSLKPSKERDPKLRKELEITHAGDILESQQWPAPPVQGDVLVTFSLQHGLDSISASGLLESGSCSPFFPLPSHPFCETPGILLVSAFVALVHQN